MSEQQPEALSVLYARRQQATRRALVSRPVPEHRPAEDRYQLPVPKELTEPVQHALAPASPGEAKGEVAHQRPTGIKLTLDDATANLAVRVRRPLDQSLTGRLMPLRAHGFRTSKAELVELLLWELDQADDTEVADRLRRFRTYAPR